MPDSTADHASKLNLGCGPVAPEGWVNIDSAPEALLVKTPSPVQRAVETLAPLAGKTVELDEWSRDIRYADLRDSETITKHAPVEAIYSGHSLEHFDRDTALQICRACYDALESDGVLRVCVPDLRSYARAYLDGDEAFYAKQSGPMADRFVSRMMLHTFHEWMYDSESLKQLLEEAGFVRDNIRDRSFREGHCPDLNRVEVHEPEKSIYVEAFAD